MKTNIKVPTDWSAVKYTDYYKFFKSVEGQEDNLQLLLESSLTYLCGVTPELLHKLPQDTFNYITDLMLELLEKQDHALVRSFKVMDKTYGMHPKIQDLSYGEYLDLVTYSKDVWKNMPIIASILYRPVTLKLGDDYTIASYTGTKEETIQMFEKLLTMDIAFGIVSFFLHLQNSLLETSLHSSMENLQKSLTTQQQALLKANGVCMDHLSQLLTEMHSSSTK